LQIHEFHPIFVHRVSGSGEEETRGHSLVFISMVQPQTQEGL